MMKFIIEFAKFFVCITTGVIIICAVNCSLSGDIVLNGDVLWNILFTGMLTALVSAVIFRSTEHFFIKAVIHYIILCFIMIFLGLQFGWMQLELSGIIMMVLSVAAVYIFTCLTRYITDYKDADRMNKALERRNKK